MTAERWSGWPPQPTEAGQHRLQWLGPDAPPALDPLPPPDLWSWRPAERAWRNPVGGRVPPDMLADGRFRYVGPAEPPPAPPPPPPPAAAPRQLALF